MIRDKDSISFTKDELIFSGLIVSIIIMMLYVWTLTNKNKTLVKMVNKLEQHNRDLLETLDLKEFPDQDGISYWWQKNLI